MMRAWLLSCVLFLLGCVDPTTIDPSYTAPITPTHPEIVYLGDSLCDKTYNFDYTAQERIGITSICKSRRLLVQVTPAMLYAQDQYEVVLVALGTNDGAKHVGIESYTARLQQFLDYDDATYYCVLPYTTNNIDRTAYRNAMQETCTNTIDPGELPVYLINDGVHWSADDHIRFAPYLANELGI